MIVHNHPIEWYVDKLVRWDYFSQGMYGDAEWICLFGDRIGGVNAENTVYTKRLSDELRQSLTYRPSNYYFSTPAVLKTLGFESRIDSLTDIEFVEKDLPWDVQARLGGLVPFIQQLQKMPVTIISNSALRRLHFLRYAHFIEISYPNCHLELDRVIEEVKTIGGSMVYLVAAGLPAALFTQRIHSMFPNCFALDIGSIWDAFVGIGAQRGWRAELYADHRMYREWAELYRDVLDPEELVRWHK
jgi:hypothetical protein